MRKKKMVSVCLALSLLLTGVLCGCGKEKKEEAKENVSSVETDDSSGKSVIENIADSTSLTDKIYADYLKEQRLCTISKGFRIIEPGVAKDNPNGLAGAVKYDFDGDKTDELVTFTFERNTQNGEDIRIDYINVTTDGTEVADSKYLTELVDLEDIYNDHIENTIYFSDTSVVEIVTSEYNDKMYFGCIVGETHDLDGLDTVYTACSVFSVDNNELKIMSSMVYDYYPISSMIYADVLPPVFGENYKSEKLIATKEDSSFAKDTIEKINSCTADKGKELLYANYNSLEAKHGSVYTESVSPGNTKTLIQSVFSNMLNEFGLDVVNNLFETDTDKTENSIYFDLAYNEKVRRIIHTKQVLSCIENDEYVGVELSLSSDLEEIIGNDSPYSEPFADELALYEDILRYPHYYRDVWDDFHELCNDRESHIYPYYCVADINKDNKYEMILTAGTDSSSYVNHVSIVLPDGSVKSYEPCGEVSFYDSGALTIRESGAYAPVNYYNIKDDSHWASCPQKQEDYTYINSIWNENDTSDNRESYSGDEADKKIAELCSGSRIVPEFNSYSLYYPDNFKDLVVVEDTSDITYTWQKAYILEINNFIKDFDIDNTDCKYSLIYIDDDEIPELYIFDTKYGRSKTYTYFDGKCSMISESGSMRANSLNGYIEKSGKFITYGSGGIYYWEYVVNLLSDGNVSESERLSYEEGVYYCNGDEISEDDFNKKLESYTSQYTEITYFTYDEIIEQLNNAE